MIKMSEVIEKIKKDEIDADFFREKPRPPWYRRVINAINRRARQVAWSLWGRRRAFAEMKRLALTNHEYTNWPTKSREQIDLDLEKKRQYFDSIYIGEEPGIRFTVEDQPLPDSDDTGTN